jgi:putative heme-binding domain-containing protein
MMNKLFILTMRVWLGLIAASMLLQQNLLAEESARLADIYSQQQQQAQRWEKVTGLRVPDGFIVTKFAGDDLAHDIFTITTDLRQQIVVSGLGYIKRLLDQDQDGIADRAEVLSTLPSSGAHGLCFTPTGLLANGDNQLTHFTNPNATGQYQQQTRWASFKTTEHGGNNIVLGPDGWYYVACGNDAGFTKAINTVTKPLITDPIAGAMIRFSPDGKQSEIVADGFRNPYGLGFDLKGRLWTYDSDNERDQYLPWYCPTRVFQVQFGRSHGWVNGGWQNGWNSPELWNPLVPRHREIGRGSPTGVLCPQAWNWPTEYLDKVLVACWSRGKLYQIEQQPEKIPDPHAPIAESEILLQAEPGTALAIVGMTSNDTGDLFVAVGGRKTAGTVYRIRYVGALTAETLTSNAQRIQAAREKVGASFIAHVKSQLAVKISDQSQALQLADEIRSAQRQAGKLPQRELLPEVLQAYQSATLPANRQQLAASWSAKFPIRITTPESTAVEHWQERQLNLELARLLAQLRAEQPDLPARILDECAAMTSVEERLHYLIVLACLPAKRTKEVTVQTAKLLCSLHQLLRQQNAIPSRHWPMRVTELLQQLNTKDLFLAGAIIVQPTFSLPEQVLFIEHLGESKAAGMIFLVKRIEEQPNTEWTPELLKGLKYLPRERALSIWRKQIDEPALTDTVIQLLAQQPSAADRQHYLAGLGSTQSSVIQAATQALLQLSQAGTPNEQLTVLSALQSLFGMPNEVAVRTNLANLYCRWNKLAPLQVETKTSKPALHYTALFQHFQKTQPDLAKKLSTHGTDWASWEPRLASINKLTGDSTRGKTLFAKWQCARCHSGAGHLGPDLKGVSSRFTPSDLLAAIVVPDKDIAPTFQVKSITTPDGKTTQGIIVYESPETTLVITGPDSTVQLSGVAPNMVQISRRSLMPQGLLNQATDQDVADLLRYLQELK